jgi:hypothetical protein
MIESPLTLFGPSFLAFRRSDLEPGPALENYAAAVVVQEEHSAQSPSQHLLSPLSQLPKQAVSQGTTEKEEWIGETPVSIKTKQLPAVPGFLVFVGRQLLEGVIPEVKLMDRCCCCRS